jgi:hypothetical protein
VQPAEEPKPTPPAPPARVVATGDKAKAATVSQEGADVWHALRVSVKPSARDPSLFVVRRLERGKAPPPDTREALIMVVDPGADLFGSSDGN